jgi:hypothetical protein
VAARVVLDDSSDGSLDGLVDIAFENNPSRYREAAARERQNGLDCERSDSFLATVAGQATPYPQPPDRECKSRKIRLSCTIREPKNCNFVVLAPTCNPSSGQHKNNMTKYPQKILVDRQGT